MMKPRLLILDVDGVLTDGCLFFDNSGDVMKAFHVHDGMGLTILRSMGIRVAVISARSSTALRARLDELNIHDRVLGAKDKVAAFRTVLVRLGVATENVVYMGDDLNDLEVMALAGFSIAPSNAVPAAREAADYTTTCAGGHGAVREACDYIAETMLKTTLAAAYKPLGVQ